MKKLMLVLLAVGVLFLLSCAAATPDKITYIQKQGYTIIYPIQSPGSSEIGDFLIVDPDGREGIAICPTDSPADSIRIVWLPYKVVPIVNR
jgi:hypothetical protein